MKQIISSGYKIFVGSESLKKLNTFLRSGKYSQFFILCDENTIQHCLPPLIHECKLLANAEIFEIESGEASKELNTASHLWQTLLEFKADKDALIINLGGGVISDLGGFIASVYKRGIDFINIPTSLLAMADASVGGKTGVNMAGIKNSLGTITQPKAVFVCPEFLATLPDRHIDNGMAEIYKIALISDKVFWNKLVSGKSQKIESTITKSIELKNAIVKKDPFEKGIRKALNFGHTIGHALESATLGADNELLHGEAIVIGMICESWISYRKKLISKDEMTEIVLALKFRFDLMKKISPPEFKKMSDQILNDKKNSRGQIQFSLLNGIGKNKLNIPVKIDLIAASVDFYNSLLK